MQRQKQSKRQILYWFIDSHKKTSIKAYYDKRLYFFVCEDNYIENRQRGTMPFFVIRQEEDLSIEHHSRRAWQVKLSYPRFFLF